MRDHEGLLLGVALDEVGLDTLEIELAPPAGDLGFGEDGREGRGDGGTAWRRDGATAWSRPGLLHR
jgi:hypothetical protein